MKLIAPSLLSADFANLESELHKIHKAGADWAHVDVMDGHFVPNLTMGPPIIQQLQKISPIPLDVHLMIENPEKSLDSYIKTGCEWITLHVESTKVLSDCFQKIKNAKIHPGITLRPGTSLDTIIPFLPQVDLVLVMTVEPGFGGQSFREDQIEKIKMLRHEISEKKLKTLIEVDGGINDQTISLCRDADVFVSGSYIFKGNPTDNIKKLKERLK